MNVVIEIALIHLLYNLLSGQERCVVFLDCGCRYPIVHMLS